MNKQWIKKGLTGIMVVGLVLMTITLTAWADTTAIEGLWERRAGEVLRITGEEGFFQEASHSGLRYFPIQVGDMKLKGITFTEENVWATTSLQWFTSGGEARSAWSETATLTLEDGGQTLSLNTHTTHPFTGRLIRSQVKYQRLEGSPVPVTEEEPIPATEPEVEEKPAIIVESEDISSEVFDSGIRMGWSKNDQALGYRVFRSTNRDDLGLSVTDFYITATRFVDVNVEPDTEYHYTVLPVLAEANPLEGIDERLGNAIAKFTKRTGSLITHVGEEKGFIILQLDNPMMIVNGETQEIDPGRGTTPIVVNGRSMVPIRAIVEAMGGNIHWDGSESKISLHARNQVVDMWLDQKQVHRNGNADQMDVAPVSQGGRTFVPIRFASENLDAKADWINSTKEIVIVYTK